MTETQITEARVTDGAMMDATDGSAVSVDTWGDGTLTLTVDGQELAMTLAAAQAAIVVLGYGVVVGR